MGPLMRSGAVDLLAFIGGSRAADALIKQHPQPHRLRVFLQLEGKNLALVLPDADLAVAAEQITLGTRASLPLFPNALTSWSRGDCVQRTTVHRD